MPMRTHTIELRHYVEDDNDETAKIMRDVVIKSAREIYSTAALISKKKPQIAVQSGDFFHKEDDVDIFGSIDGERAADDGNPTG